MLFSISSVGKFCEKCFYCTNITFPIFAQSDRLEENEKRQRIIFERFLCWSCFLCFPSKMTTGVFSLNVKNLCVSFLGFYLFSNNITSYLYEELKFIDDTNVYKNKYAANYIFRVYVQMPYLCMMDYSFCLDFYNDINGMGRQWMKTKLKKNEQNIHRMESK